MFSSLVSRLDSSYSSGKQSLRTFFIFHSPVINGDTICRLTISTAPNDCFCRGYLDLSLLFFHPQCFLQTLYQYFFATRKASIMKNIPFVFLFFCYPFIDFFTKFVQLHILKLQRIALYFFY